MVGRAKGCKKWRRARRGTTETRAPRAEPGSRNQGDGARVENPGGKGAGPARMRSSSPAPEVSRSNMAAAAEGVSATLRDEPVRGSWSRWGRVPGAEPSQLGAGSAGPGHRSGKMEPTRSIGRWRTGVGLRDGRCRAGAGLGACLSRT